MTRKKGGKARQRYTEDPCPGEGHRLGYCLRRGYSFIKTLSRGCRGCCYRVRLRTRLSAASEAGSSTSGFARLRWVLRRGEDEPVVVGHAVAFRLGLQDPQEGPHYDPVELCVDARAQLLPRLRNAHARAAGLVEHHRGVGLRHRENLRLQRYPSPPQLVGVTPSVRPLVVPAHPRCHLLVLRYSREDLLSACRVLGELTTRYGVELAGRQQ